VLLALLAACGTAERPGTGPVASPGPSALILVMDGVRVSEFTSTTVSELTGAAGEDYAAHTWDAVAPFAAVHRAAVNPAVTATSPAHVQLLSGHVEPFANQPVEDGDVGLYRPTFPTLFEEARSQQGWTAQEVQLIANADLLHANNAGFWPGLGPDYGAAFEFVAGSDGQTASEDDEDVFAAVRRAIEDGPPRLVLANIHDVDRSGHFGAAGDYEDGVQIVDEGLAEFFRWLQEDQPSYAADLRVAVVADHGRHSHEDDGGYRNHGDACVGCREVPLFLFGAGVLGGRELTGTVTTLDLVPTLAGHLGVETPWADGLAVSAALEKDEGQARSGEFEVAVDGELVAVARFTDDPERRSEVEVDGSVLSSTDAWGAAGPVVLRTDSADYACFREMTLEEGAASWPWRPRCFSRGTGDWVEIGFPDDEISAVEVPVLQADGDGVLVAWDHNADLAAGGGEDDRIGVRTATWDGGAWSEASHADALFPTDMSAAGGLLAFGTNAGKAAARYTRHVEVGTIDDGFSSVDLSAVLGEGARGELPALSADGASLAMLGYDGARFAIAVAQAADDWATVTLLPVEGDASPNLAPEWDGSAVVWVELRQGEAWLCRAEPGDGAAACQDLGTPRVRDLALVSGGAEVIVDAGVGEWRRAGFRF
jgi:hypothetical protein